MGRSIKQLRRGAPGLQCEPLSLRSEPPELSVQGMCQVISGQEVTSRSDSISHFPQDSNEGADQFPISTVAGYYHVRGWKQYKCVILWSWVSGMRRRPQGAETQVWLGCFRLGDSRKICFLDPSSFQRLRTTPGSCSLLTPSHPGPGLLVLIAQPSDLLSHL